MNDPSQLAGEPVAEWFGPLFGQPCWGVLTSQADMSLEFGSPILKVREPRHAEPALSDRVKFASSRRRVSVYGDHSLFISACRWRYFQYGQRFGDNFYARRMKRAACAIDGQKLVRVEIDPVRATTEFNFDLDGVLRLKPMDPESDQWWVTKPDGHCFTLRGDGAYSCSLVTDERPNWKRFF